MTDLNANLLRLAEQSIADELAVLNHVIVIQSEHNSKLINILMSFAALSLIVVLGYAFYLTKKLLSGFVGIRSIMTEFSKGNLTPPLTYRFKDELGHTILILNNALEKVQLIVRGITPMCQASCHTT